MEWNAYVLDRENTPANRYAGAMRKRVFQATQMVAELLFIWGVSKKEARKRLKGLKILSDQDIESCLSDYYGD